MPIFNEVQPGWLNNLDASKYCGLSPRSLQNHRSRGTGPRYAKIDDSIVRYSRKDLDAWMEAHLVGGRK